jgi:hypothetical protein
MSKVWNNGLNAEEIMEDGRPPRQIRKTDATGNRAFSLLKRSHIPRSAEQEEDIGVHSGNPHQR